MRKGREGKDREGERRKGEGTGGKEKERGRGEKHWKTAENRNFLTKFSTLGAPVLTPIPNLGQIWQVSAGLS